jgi:hypothetical protein
LQAGSLEQGPLGQKRPLKPKDVWAIRFEVVPQPQLVQDVREFHSRLLEQLDDARAALAAGREVGS